MEASTAFAQLLLCASRTQCTSWSILGVARVFALIRGIRCGNCSLSKPSQETLLPETTHPLQTTSLIYSPSGWKEFVRPIQPFERSRARRWVEFGTGVWAAIHVVVQEQALQVERDIPCPRGTDEDRLILPTPDRLREEAIKRIPV